MIDYSPTTRTPWRWLSRLCRHCLVAAAALGLATAGINAAQAQETLIAGATPSGIPFTFLDVSSGKITGAMVDLIEAVGQDMGAQVEIKESDRKSVV